LLLARVLVVLAVDDAAFLAVLLAVVVAAMPAKAQKTDMTAAAWKNFIGKQKRRGR
jgi:hypothetical protein